MDAPSPAQGGPGARASLELSRADIGFAAAHFSVVGGRAERLHGHNYRVALRAHGDVAADGTVVDFGVLKSALRAECDELDEHMLLPTSSEVVHVHAEGHVVTAEEGRRRFVFPAADVRLLAIPNTTCECLAAYLLSRLRARLGATPVRLEVSVEEVPGQSATVKE